MSSDEPKALDDTIPAKEEGTQPSDPGATPPAPPSQPSRKSLPTVPPPAGQERYEIRSELGRGGMGRVVEAFDIQLGRVVALKEVLPKAGTASARRFAREVALTAKLEHPSIVPLYDSGTTPDGRPYYVMRKVTGRPLDELVLRTRKLDERLALLPHVQAAIDAVAHAHARGVIHRDLKPANILIGEHGETVVIDWGLAKVIGEPDDPANRDSLPSDSLQTQMGSVFGTPGFMAPEQARGDEIGTHGDVYALGATLYQLLAGTPPHSGNSATAVIEKTLKHSMIPLADIAPGAPAELVTIVNKALSHEPEHRYPHAGALGEDLRRFLAGQLVAAHRYTATERFVRFVRKYRGVLGVASLAILALAILGWISVKRIMHERDAATSARAEAVKERDLAKRANQALAERHEALLVSRARTRVNINPTEALATLKDLPANTTQLDEARAVAQAAVLRGVTWAMQTEIEFTTIAQMSPDARQLLQVTRDGAVRIWDLARRRVELERKFSAHTRAIWIAGGKLFITHEGSPPAILDPKTNNLENLTMDPVTFAIASREGERVAFESKTGGGMFDTGSRTVKMLTAEPVREIAIAPDGTSLAYTTAKDTVIVDGTGTEIARLPAATRVEFSPARAVAALVDNRILELDMSAAKPEFREIVLPADRKDYITDLLYAGRNLIVMVRLEVYSWNGARGIRLGKLESIVNGMHVADDKFVLVASTDNRIQLLDHDARGAVQLPANVLHPRLVTHPKSSLVMVVADGIILGFDLEMLRPKVIDTGGDTFTDFVDDDTLLASHSVSRTWEWVDIASGKKTPIDVQTLGLSRVLDIDDRGRVLVGERTVNGFRVVLLHKGETKTRPIVEGQNAWGRLVSGNAMIYSDGSARVMAVIDDGAPRELVKVEGLPDGAAPVARRKVAIHTSHGELLRIDLETGATERTTIALGNTFQIASDGTTGRVILAEDGRVMTWDGGKVIELAKFEKPIREIFAMQGGYAAVVLQDNETYLVETKAPGTPIRVAAAGRIPPRTSLDAKLLVSVGNAQQIEVLELPQRTRWSVPQTQDSLDSMPVIVSPTKRRILQTNFGSVVIWTLPHAPAQDFAQWLDEQTNARVDTDGELLWPWQRPNPQKAPSVSIDTK